MTDTINRENLILDTGIISTYAENIRRKLELCYVFIVEPRIDIELPAVDFYNDHEI